MEVFPSKIIEVCCLFQMEESQNLFTDVEHFTPSKGPQTAASRIDDIKTDVLIEISKHRFPNTIKNFKLPHNWDEKKMNDDDAVKIGISFCISRNTRNLSKYNTVRIINALGRALFTTIPEFKLRTVNDDDSKTITNSNENLMVRSNAQCRRQRSRAASVFRRETPRGPEL